MAEQDIELLARKFVGLEKKHDTLARSRQLPNSSVRLVDGSEMGISDGAETSKDSRKDLDSLEDISDINRDLVDDEAINSAEVPDWIIGVGGAADVAWDSTQFATDLALALETELGQAQIELEQALTDAAAAQASATTARAEAAQAVLDAEAAVVAAAAAKAAADSKSGVWYQDNPPAGTEHSEGDTWFDTGDGNKIYHWDGTTWVAAELGTNALANLSITNAKVANLNAAKINAGFLSADRIEALSIVGDKIAANAITATKIQANAIIAEKIQANAITTAKINALAITTDKLAVGSVVADKIATGAITAGKIQAQAIDGMTITGALIRTAPSGQRMEFNVNGLTSYNSSGSVTSSLYASAGSLELSGSLLNESATGNYAIISQGTISVGKVASGVTNHMLLESSTARHSIISRTFGGSASDRLPIEIEAPSIQLNGPINSNRIQKTLWSGAWYMRAGQSADLSELVSDQLNGIILVWSRYSAGTAHNDSWNFTYVPKAHVAIASGAGISAHIAHGTSQATSQKYVYVSDNAVSGNDFNGTAPNNWSVLRRVLGY